MDTNTSKAKQQLHLFGSTNAIAAAVKRQNAAMDTIEYSLNQFSQFGGESVHFKLVENLEHIIIYSWGVLNPERLLEQDEAKTWNSLYINFVLPARLLEMLNQSKIKFRFVYISSESAIKGSYDATYAMGKAAMERFIREIRINKPDSSCVAIAPSMIEDAGMTVRRSDQENVVKALETHPKRRLLRSAEVAKMINWIINEGSDYLTNTTIHLDGGKFSRMIYK